MLEEDGGPHLDPAVVRRDPKLLKRLTEAILKKLQSY
jgi:hypothetical protein